MTLPWMAERIQLRAIASLRPHAGNARVHDAAQLAQIMASMQAFGFTNPLLVDEDGVLIAGHGRLAAAEALGIAKVPVIVLKHLAPAQKEALRLADNRIAENATWDQALLRDALASAQAAEIDLAALGFSADELAGILAAAGDAVSDGDAPEALPVDTAENPAAPAIGEDADDPADAEPEAPRQAVSRPGDLWLLGAHRLLCGDSTDAAAVARVMEGDRAAMLFTSPPYGNQRAYTTGGVSDWDALMQGVFQHLDAALRPDGQALVNLGLIHRENEWQPYWDAWLEWMRAHLADMGWQDPPYNVAYEGGTAAKMTIANDALGKGFLDFLRPALTNLLSVTKGACYICMSSSEWPTLHRAWQEAGGKWSSTIIWAKNTFALGRADYHQQFEAMLYGWKAGAQHYWCGARDQGNVWHFDKPARNDLHPTMKPVALVERAIRNSSKPRDTVLDCFGGSGTTMIAAERTGRRAVLLEIDPAYCDVIVQRWQEETGQAAVLDGEDRTFADVAARRRDSKEIWLHEYETQC